MSYSVAKMCAILVLLPLMCEAGWSAEPRGNPVRLPFDVPGSAIERFSSLEEGSRQLKDGVSRALGRILGEDVTFPPRFSQLVAADRILHGRRQGARTPGVAIGAAVDPPFDVTGSYLGEWWSGEGAHCSVGTEMDLGNHSSLLGIWFPTAIFEVGFECLDPEAESMTIPTIGIMDATGTVTYLALGCTIGMCALFTTTGTGVDADADTLMDRYEGEWAYVIGIAFFPVFGVTGEFSLERLEEVP